MIDKEIISLLEKKIQNIEYGQATFTFIVHQGKITKIETETSEKMILQATKQN